MSKARQTSGTSREAEHDSPGSATSDAARTGAPFLLRVGGGEEGEEPTELRVLRLRGREALSRPCRFDLVVIAEHPPESLRAWLDRPAALVLATPGEPRNVHGLIVSATSLGVTAHGLAFRLVLASRLARLKLRARARIFQDSTPPEVITAVLGEAGIAHEWRTQRTYPRRACLTQHHETDLAFVGRLLAEVGIFYFIEPPPAGDPAAQETVVFADSAVYAPLAGGHHLYHRPHAYGALGDGDDTVHEIAAVERVASTLYARREYDPRRPLVGLACAASAGVADHGRTWQPEIFEHLGEHDPTPVELEHADAALEQLRREATSLRGRSMCRRLSPGRSIQMHGEAGTPGAGSALVVTCVIHRGRAPEMAGRGPIYDNHFHCVPADRALRPPRPARRVRQTIETAVVTGPAGSEIHTDGHGRIQVRFHWDRGEGPDKHTSCWIRVSQPWAGAGWGVQFVPRVGMEVIVGFLQGDPDQPILLGCVPNAMNPLPYEPTRSGIRTASTPGEGAHNEIAFEDRHGAEELAIHAARDLAIRAAGDELVQIAGRHDVRVAGAESQEIGGSRVVEVGGNAGESVLGSRNDHVGRAWTQAAGQDLAQHVGGTRLSEVAGDDVATVRGRSSLIVGTPERAACRAEYVHGCHMTNASEAIRLSADQSISLVVGTSVLEIGPDKIRLSAETVEVAGGELLTVRGKGPSLSLGESVECVGREIRLFAEVGQLLLDKEARLNGERVKLNCSDEKAPLKKEDGSSVELVPFRMKLTDRNFEPYANKTYHLIADGLRYEGETAADGLVDKQIPKESRAITITVWVADYPEGERRTFHVQRGQKGADGVEGAQMRLSNLGYLKGALSGRLDDATRAALASFQSDAGLPVTGKLDGPTAEKLAAVQGASLLRPAFARGLQPDASGTIAACRTSITSSPGSIASPPRTWSSRCRSTASPTSCGTCCTRCGCPNRRRAWPSPSRIPSAGRSSS